MEIYILAIVIGLIPAAIAQSKGRSFLVWWIYGAGLFIIALPHALIMKPDQKSIDNKSLNAGMKKCPFCAEIIRDEAVVCRYCGKDLPVHNLVPEITPMKEGKYSVDYFKPAFEKKETEELLQALKRPEEWSAEGYEAIKRELNERNVAF